MRSAIQTSHLAALTIIAILMGVIGYQSGANVPQATPTPAVVVCVNLERVYSGLLSREAADETLQTMGRELDKEVSKRSNAVEALEEELKLFAEGSTQWEEKNHDWLRATIDYRTFIQFGELKLDYQKAKVLKGLYDEIRSATTRLAERNGYDFVIVNDNVGPVEPVGEKETMQQISRRRLLYHRPSLDVTAELIQMMNNEFAQQANAAGDDAASSP